MPTRLHIAAGTLIALVLGAAAWWLAPTDSSEPPKAEVPPAGDALVIGVPADGKDLLSPVAQSSLDLNLLDLIGVKALENTFDCELKYKPALAKSWSWSEDGKTLRMELRTDLLWSDGKPVVAADLTLLGELIADPDVGSPHAQSYARVVQGARPRVIDATHIEFEFLERTDPTSMIANVTSLQIVPSHLLSDANIDRKTLRQHPLNATSPLASGPWQLARWDKNERIAFEPNPNWVGTKPSLRKVIFKVIPSYDTRLLELQNGSIDMMESLQVSDADKLVREHPEIKLVRRGWRAMDYIGWNTVDPEAYKAARATKEKPDLAKLPPHPLFGDPKVRHALSMAIDVDKLIADVLTSSATGEVYARRAVSTITPALCGVHNDSIKPITRDVEGARKALSALGWTDTNGDGVIDRDGVPFRFVMVTSAGSTRRTQVSAIVKSQLQEIGVDVQFEALEGSALYDRLRRKDFDAAYTGWSAGLWVEPANAWAKDSEFNFYSYQNPKATALLEAGAKESDAAKARQIWNDFQQVVYDDQPYTFLYWMDEIVAINGRFENTSIDLISPYHHLEAWSVPPAKVKYKQ